MSCNICCENFNHSTRARVTCKYGTCDFEACKSCIRTYILNSFNDPHCMGCKHPFDEEYLIKNLNRSFVKSDYKIHRKEFLFQREKSQFPATMQQARDERIAREVSSEVCAIEKQIKALKTSLLELESKKRRKLAQVHVLRYGKAKEQEEKQKFIMPCSKEGCNGFLSSAYKCELCKEYTCSHCLVPLGEHRENPDHVCDEGAVKTADLIRESTKPCPSCGERIQKIEGCDQMWCPSCNTAFHWSTGKIDNGPIHNPHYYEYLRDNNNVAPVPRNVGDVVCGGIPHNLHYKVSRSTVRGYAMNSSDSNSLNYVIDCVRQITHCTQVVLQDHRGQRVSLQNTSKIRVKYMLNDFDEKKFKELIYRNDLARKLNVEYCNIWELFSHVGIDLLRFIDDIMGNIKDQNSFNEHWVSVIKRIKEFAKFIDYHNGVMKHIADVYKIKTLRFKITATKLLSITC